MKYLKHDFTLQGYINDIIDCSAFHMDAYLENHENALRTFLQKTHLKTKIEIFKLNSDPLLQYSTCIHCINGNQGYSLTS